MSDTARPKSYGDKLSSEEINQDLPVQVNAGETINGATLPVPVYMDDTDNEVKACDANDVSRLEFIGFAVSNSTDGNAITLQKNGVVGGFSSLDIGKKYYVQDTVGTIGTSPGTNEVLVGIAISATQIRIIKQPAFEVIASNNLRDSADTTESHNTTTYNKEKEIQFNETDGEITVKFTAYQANEAGNCYARIYINGSPVGTERTITSSTATEYSEDIQVSKGDLIQLYIKLGTHTDTVYCKNFRLYYDKVPTIVLGTINLN